MRRCEGACEDQPDCTQWTRVGDTRGGGEESNRIPSVRTWPDTCLRYYAKQLLLLKSSQTVLYLAALHGDPRRARACYVGVGRRSSVIERDLASDGGGRGRRAGFFVFTWVNLWRLNGCGLGGIARGSEACAGLLRRFREERQFHRARSSFGRGWQGLEGKVLHLHTGQLCGYLMGGVEVQRGWGLVWWGYERPEM